MPLGDETIKDLQPCGNTISVAAGDPAFGLVDGNGRIGLWKTGVAPNMRDKLGDAFTIASDARKVRFGLGDGGEEPVLFDLAQATVTNAPDLLPGFLAPLVEGLPVGKWSDDYHPTFAGKPIQLDQYEFSRSLAIRPDRTGFVLGTEYYLRAFDADGRQLWQQPRVGVTWGVNFGRRPHHCGAYGDGPSLAPLVGWQGAVGPVRRQSRQALGGVDALRLLHGLARR